MNLLIATLGFLDRVADLPGWAHALLAALGGVTLAWAYYFGGTVGPVAAFWLLVIVVVGVILLTLAAWEAGEKVLGPTIRLGVRLMGLRVWLELALGAIGVGIGIWIAATVVPTGASPSDVTKAVVSGWGAGLSAAVTAGLAKRAEDADDRVGAKIAKAVGTAYGAVFTDPESEGWRAVYSDPIWEINGWGRSAREMRAQLIEAALAKPGGQPPTPESRFAQQVDEMGCLGGGRG